MHGYIMMYLWMVIKTVQLRYTKSLSYVMAKLENVFEEI